MTPIPAEPQNAILAANLRELADLLQQQEADGFRVAAYRRAAEVVEGLGRPVAEILTAAGRDGLMTVPGVGSGIASALAEMVTTGHLAQLDRLRGIVEPERLFQTIPGIGPKLARKICDRLQIETLEALEVAAHDGGLEEVDGIGARRAQMIRAALTERLGRPRIRHPGSEGQRPSVALLLDVDREYRERAKAGTLRKIAPKRFNSSGEAWLPVLHTSREEWEFTALFSNTLLAHEFGRTEDWVIIYYRSDGLPEARCTVVTEFRGILAGQRVVRGREEECGELLRKPNRERLERPDENAAPAGQARSP